MHFLLNTYGKRLLTEEFPSSMMKLQIMLNFA